MIQFYNPNYFPIAVGVRGDGRGKNFIVAPRKHNRVYVPNGEYDLYIEFLHYRLKKIRPLELTNESVTFTFTYKYK